MYFYFIFLFWYIFTPTLQLFAQHYFLNYISLLALSNIVLLSGGNSEWQAEVQVDREGKTERKKCENYRISWEREKLKLGRSRKMLKGRNIEEELAKEKDNRNKIVKVERSQHWQKKGGANFCPRLITADLQPLNHTEQLCVCLFQEQ